MSETNSELESALRALSPLPAALDRDRLMYLAGQASRPGWPWKLSSGLLAATAVMLGVFLALKPAPEVRIVVVREPAPKSIQETRPQEEPYASPEPMPLLTPGSHVPDLAYYRLQQQVSRFGEEGLPGMSANPGPPTVEPPLKIPRNGPSTGPMNLFHWQ